MRYDSDQVRSAMLYLTKPPTPEMEGVTALIIAAQQAAADNREKARSEANRGAFKFAKLHEVASLTYEEDAAAMISSGAPIHRSLPNRIAAIAS